MATIEELGLSLDELQGQGYDGAATMKWEKSGVQKQIYDSQQNLCTLTVLGIQLISH